MGDMTLHSNRTASECRERSAAFELAAAQHGPPRKVCLLSYKMPKPADTILLWEWLVLGCLDFR